MTATEGRLRGLLVETTEMLARFPSRVLTVGEDPNEWVDVLSLYSKIMDELKTSEASARGRSSRSRGHATENLVVTYLRAHGFPDAATTRSTLGHDGTRQPGDVTFSPGVVLSVKHVKTPAWPAWIREVAEEARAAGGWQAGFSPRVPAVVHRKLGEVNVGAWPCAVPLVHWDGVLPRYRRDGPVGGYAELIDSYGLLDGEFIDHRPAIGRPAVAVMRFETLCNAFELKS